MIVWGGIGPIQTARGNGTQRLRLLAVCLSKDTALGREAELSDPAWECAEPWAWWGQLWLAWPQGSAFLWALLGLNGRDHAFTQKTETKSLNWARSGI